MVIRDVRPCLVFAQTRKQTPRDRIRHAVVVFRRSLSPYLSFFSFFFIEHTKRNKDASNSEIRSKLMRGYFIEWIYRQRALFGATPSAPFYSIFTSPEWMDEGDCSRVDCNGLAHHQHDVQAALAVMRVNSSRSRSQELVLVSSAHVCVRLFG